MSTDKATPLEQVYFKFSGEYLEYLNSFNKKYKGSLTKKEEENLDKEELRRIMSKILKYAQTIDGLIVSQQTGQGFNGVLILEYKNDEDFRLIVMDTKENTAKLISKKPGIIVRTMGIGQHNAQSLSRLPNGTKDLLDELLRINQR